MKTLQPFHDLDEDFPDFTFLEVSVVLLVLADLVVKIASVRIFHDNAESGRSFDEKCFFI